MSASRVEIPCIKGKCCRPSTSTDFDSTHPAELSGIISPDEFTASIARINASLKRPKWTFRVQTAGRVLIVLGIVILLIAGGKYFRMKHRHHHEDHSNSNSNPNSNSNFDPSVLLDARTSTFTSTGTNEAFDQFTVSQPMSPVGGADDAPVRSEEDDEEYDQKMAAAGEKKYHHSKHGKCIKHLLHSGIISLIIGFVLCRWIAGRKIRQLITRVVPAVCAEHHLYTSSSRAVPVSWSLDERSICKYMCKNNGLKLVLDLHSLVPLSRMEEKQISNNAAEKQEMVAGSAYVPLTTNDQA